jgi:carboxyl-terminal processing protease
MDMIKKPLLAIGIFILAASGLITCSFLPKDNINPDKAVVTESLLMQMVNGAHFRPKPLDDKFSEDLFELYIRRLDFNKKFFTQEDINQLEKYRKQLDEELFTEKIDFFTDATKILEERTQQVEGFYKDLLSQPFDFTVEESIETESKKLKYAANEKELREEWRKLLKYQTLVRLAEMVESQEKLAAKKDTVVELKSMEVMEKEAREKVEKTYVDFFKRVKRQDQTDRLNLFISSMANVFDPHTEFFPPRIKENFDIAMSGQLEGIGAQLQERDGNIRVSNIVPGSPSWRQGELKAGDVILKVAQGNGDWVDVSDMRLDDAVSLIRGKKGTEVRLTVRKVDGSMKVISIIRDIVILEETYAKSLLIDDGQKVGYIKLPSFYADFNKVGGKRCAADMRNEIMKLKSENVKGLIIDLRNNGGGSLQDVVEIAGFFIPSGPVVQVKSRGSSPEILVDKDPSVLYDGPLVIMVNNISASASEILAAAMQDYKRGIVIGGEQTFGKGTVQRVFNLDDYASRTHSAMRPFGSVKLTTQKFYRINGATTQLNGVSSDIVLPDRFEKLYRGEREEDFAMAWDEISKAEYEAWKGTGFNLNDIKQKSKNRISKSEAFQYISELEKQYQKRAEETIVSLKLEKYRSEQKKNTDENDKLDKLSEKLPSIAIQTLQGDLGKIDSDSTKKAVHEEWIKTVTRDFYLREAVNVIKDWK